MSEPYDQNPLAGADGLDPKAWVPDRSPEPWDDDDDPYAGSGTAAVDEDAADRLYDAWAGDQDTATV